MVPNCHADHTFTAMIDIDEQAPPGPADTVASIQCALLYTNSDGERRIRVHTTSVCTTNSVADIHNAVDPEVVTLLLGQQALDMASAQPTTATGGGKLFDARAQVQQFTQQLVSAASPNCDPVKAVPLYTLGLLKSYIFRATNDVLPDLRLYHWIRSQALPVSMYQAMVYPRLINLTRLSPSHGRPLPGDQGRVELPPNQSLSAESLHQVGVCVLCSSSSPFRTVYFYSRTVTSCLCGSAGQ